MGGPAAYQAQRFPAGFPAEDTGKAAGVNLKQCPLLAEVGEKAGVVQQVPVPFRVGKHRVEA